jgi:hypothetical protein
MSIASSHLHGGIGSAEVDGHVIDIIDARRN